MYLLCIELLMITFADLPLLYSKDLKQHYSILCFGTWICLFKINRSLKSYLSYDINISSHYEVEYPCIDNLSEMTTFN